MPISEAMWMPCARLSRNIVLVTGTGSGVSPRGHRSSDSRPRIRRVFAIHRRPTALYLAPTKEHQLAHSWGFLARTTHRPTHGSDLRHTAFVDELRRARRPWMGTRRAEAKEWARSADLIPRRTRFPHYVMLPSPALVAFLSLRHRHRRGAPRGVTGLSRWSCAVRRASLTGRGSVMLSASAQRRQPVRRALTGDAVITADLPTGGRTS